MTLCQHTIFLKSMVWYWSINVKLWFLVLMAMKESKYEWTDDLTQIQTDRLHSRWWLDLGVICNSVCKRNGKLGLYRLMRLSKQLLAGNDSGWHRWPEVLPTFDTEDLKVGIYPQTCTFVHSQLSVQFYNNVKGNFNVFSSYYTFISR